MADDRGGSLAGNAIGATGGEGVGVDKKALRARLRAIREQLGEDGRARIDSSIAAKVCALESYQAADAVFTYLSVGAEVDTREIIRDAWSRGKMVAVPRCVPGSRVMDWYRIESFDNMEVSSLGVEEPLADPDKLVGVPAPQDGPTNAIAIVPGLSFDAEGYRLGYGGGFYDVFLPAFGGASIGLCRTVQLSDVALPRFDTDVPVDLVITD